MITVKVMSKNFSTLDIQRKREICRDIMGYSTQERKQFLHENSRRLLEWGLCVVSRPDKLEGWVRAVEVGSAMVSTG
jgi:hypothetical protein